MFDIVIYNLFDANVFYFFIEMENIKLLINCGRHWEQIIYNDGYSEITFVHINLTYEDLLSRVHEIVCVDFNNCVYKIFFC